MYGRIAEPIEQILGVVGGHNGQACPDPHGDQQVLVQSTVRHRVVEAGDVMGIRQPPAAGRPAAEHGITGQPPRRVTGRIRQRPRGVR